MNSCDKVFCLLKFYSGERTCRHLGGGDFYRPFISSGTATQRLCITPRAFHVLPAMTVKTACGLRFQGRRQVREALLSLRGKPSENDHLQLKRGKGD